MFVGCEKNNNPISEDGGNSIPLISIEGRINDWHYGGNRYVVLMYRDSQFFPHTTATSQIDSVGRFFLENLGSLPESSQGTTVYPSESEYVKFIDNSFTCTDSSAKFIWGQFEVMGNCSSQGYCGWIARTSYDFNQRISQPGDFDVTYIYATKDVKLNGTVKARIYAGNDTTEIEETYHYNATYQRGWNQQIKLYVAQDVFKDSNKTVYSYEYSLTSNEPYQGKWFYYGN